MSDSLGSLHPLPCRVNVELTRSPSETGRRPGEGVCLRRGHHGRDAESCVAGLSQTAFIVKQHAYEGFRTGNIYPKASGGVGFHGSRQEASGTRSCLDLNKLESRVE